MLETKPDRRRTEDRNAHPEGPFDGQQHERDAQDRRGENLNDGGTVKSPIRTTAFKPSHAGGRIVWMVTMKFRPVKIG